jgi:hypothetical protein
VLEESELQRALSENAALRLALKQAIEERDASAQKAAFATRRIEELQGKIRALMEQVALLERRIFAAKKERIDHQQLDLEFAGAKKELDALQRELQGQLGAPSDAPSNDGNKPSSPKPKAKPTGKRDLAACTSMPTQSIVITDPEGEALVLAGKASRIEAPPSYRLGFVRGGYTRVAITLMTYRVETAELGAEKRATLITALQAPTLFPRSLATPSLVAKILIDKYADGLPLYRQEERLSREGLELDRGTMSRWVQTSGVALGPLMNAFKKHALDNALCAAVDATGVLIQPALSERKGSHQACRKGHFFGIVIDKSAVAFEYTRHETSAAVQSMLGGFKGYVQSDAKNVFDILDEREDAAPRLGCWAHCRRHFYDAAAVNRDKRALEALMRIGRIYKLERDHAKSPPSARRVMRDTFARAEVDAFFAWLKPICESVEHERGLTRSAFLYARNQEPELRTYLSDERLNIDNNRCERALRTVAVGRKNWLFIGSDEHAESTAAIMTAIASSRVNGLDPNSYLRDMLRVLPHWPKERLLELAPTRWLVTRSTLNQAQLEAEMGPLDVPEMSER